MSAEKEEILSVENELQLLAKQRERQISKLRKIIDEDVDLFNFAYWNTSIPQSSLISGCCATKLIKPHPVEIKCSRCGETAFTKTARTRSERDGFLDGSAFIGIGEILCYKCKESAGLNEIRKLKTMPYRDYLMTDHWKKKRKEKLESVGYKCQLCGRSNIPLQVHHNVDGSPCL